MLLKLTIPTTELDNSVKLVDPARDGLYEYSPSQQKAINEAKPWRSNPNYFTNVRISAVALLKMVMHARSGGSIEIMGLMEGKILDNTFIVTDAFRLPVEGTETRVNAQDEANEYMVNYANASRESGRMENIVGWYHSHPGYGCWLSGIDVATQATQQTFQDPFLAVVIDPDRTISAGKVEIGAFRTYPEDYKPSANADDDYQSIPLNKIEDFGAHASRYYSLEISTFKSTLDTQLLQLLWNKYWVQTLSQSPLFTNREYSSKQMLDLAGKIRNAGQSVSRTSKAGIQMDSPTQLLRVERDIEKIVRDSEKICGEEKTGLMARTVKQSLFQGFRDNEKSNGAAVTEQEASDDAPPAESTEAMVTS